MRVGGGPAARHVRLIAAGAVISVLALWLVGRLQPSGPHRPVTAPITGTSAAGIDDSVVTTVLEPTRSTAPSPANSQAMDLPSAPASSPVDGSGPSVAVPPPDTVAVPMTSTAACPLHLPVHVGITPSANTVVTRRGTGWVLTWRSGDTKLELAYPPLPQEYYGAPDDEFWWPVYEQSAVLGLTSAFTISGPELTSGELTPELRRSAPTPYQVWLQVDPAERRLSKGCPIELRVTPPAGPARAVLLSLPDFEFGRIPSYAAYGPLISQVRRASVAHTLGESFLCPWHRAEDVTGSPSAATPAAALAAYRDRPAYPGDRRQFTPYWEYRLAGGTSYQYESDRGWGLHEVVVVTGRRGVWAVTGFGQITC